MTEFDAISKSHARAQNVKSWKSLMRRRSTSFENSVDVSRDQTGRVRFPIDSVNTDLRIIDGNMVHVDGFDMSEREVERRGYDEPVESLFGQRQQLGNGSKLCSAAPSTLENHNGPTSSVVRLKSDCSSNASGMHTQWQSASRSSLMPSYLRLRNPVEAMPVQHQVNQQYYAEPTLSTDASGSSKDFKAKSDIKKACQSALLGMCHAQSCTLSAAGKCPLRNCIEFKKLLQHIAQCKGVGCINPRCSLAKTMITHFRQCKGLGCSLCVPVKIYLTKLKNSLETPSGTNHGQCNTKIASTTDACEDLKHPPKKARTDVPCILTTEKPISGSSHEDSSLASHRDSKLDTRAPDSTSVKALEIFRHKSLEHDELLHTSTDCVTESMERPKLNCASLTELFTPEEVRQHIRCLRQWLGQSKLNADKNQLMEQSMNQNSCQLCSAEELNLEPRPIYCTQCYSRIKRKAVYYMLTTVDARHCFCTTCHTAIRVEFVASGVTFLKSELQKRKNIEHIQESWVQCDKCHGWQHNICALFNSRMNGEGQAKYTCPNCYVKEIERGDRVVLPQAAFPGAKDLPRTALSDHIERRLHRRLQDEKVLGSGDLTVRVVLSVDKKLKVKKNFLEIFQGDDYPLEFPYKSKVILMFQNIEGVEVCLFAMSVQEFGSECDFPNKRWVYISYLDSVKYFKPDAKLITRESLRTFVYHEVLLGYLEYCKARGFTSCYIWVCPPPKGEDYIFYCHPESQRTPKKEKLREWYLSMLKKAVNEDIVVEIGNLYDDFLFPTGECNAKITAARLPYFDGDYWPGVAEEKLQRFSEEGEEVPSKKSSTKKPLPKRSLRTNLHSEISDSSSKDEFLISEIGKIIDPVKEDFITVYLQHRCARCFMFILSGNRWQCEQCSSFRLCDRCYEAEQRRGDRDRHPSKKPFKHLLRPFEILNVPSETKDADGIIESDIFDSRQTFLNFCQGNYYQNDTVRRAMHSSMMLLYHLHNPTVPAFVTTCNVCHLDIEPGRSSTCEVCFDYEICRHCHERLPDSGHPHKLTKHPSPRRTKETREQVNKMNELLVHVQDCHSRSCKYADCRKLKWLFHHSNQCATRALKGCITCRKLWYLLKIHSTKCHESNCRVPRCSDLKLHSRRLRQRLETQSRAAVSMQRIAKADGESRLV